MQGTITDKAYKGFKHYEIPKNSTVNIAVSNPCFVFMNESDSGYLIAYTSGSNTVISIHNTLAHARLTKTATYNLQVENPLGWTIHVWTLQY